MKYLITLLFLVISHMAFSQAPEKMSYQAVIRDSSNNIVSNQSVSIRISILRGFPAGNVVYSETHSKATNFNGLISFEIGEGSNKIGSIGNIQWDKDQYFIQTETDPYGGTSYMLNGVNQILSVAYALHSNTADSLIGGGIGPQGETGLQGIQGLKGDTGVAGIQGIQGAQGIQGLKGDKGLKGDTGVAGIQGIQGAQGIQGLKGDKGLKGDTGVAGIQGIQGAQGIQGLKGDKGLKGDTGVAGIQGIQGAQGIQGLKGDKGLKGDTGVAGAAAQGTVVNAGLNVTVTGNGSPMVPYVVNASIDDADADTTNEIQTLSVVNDSISISNGNTVSLKSKWGKNVNDLFYDLGSVSIGNKSPDSSSSLDLSGIAKGFFLPTLTLVQRQNLVSPPDGLLIYQTNSKAGIYIRQNSKWQRLETSFGSSPKTLIYTTDGF